MVSTSPNKTEIRNPYIKRATTSRPWSSVPSQFSAVGPEGAAEGKS